jgi:hypothetical protein
MPRVPYLIALLCLPLVVGCEGCRRDADPDADAKEREAPVEDFTALPAQAFPGDANVAAGGIKPGHWLTASQGLKSNKIDSRGELQSRASGTGSNFSTGAVATSVGEIPSLRPIVLPKGQTRRFDYRLLAPRISGGDQRRTFLSSRYVSTGRSVFYDTGKQPFNVLSDEEYFFVILTTRPQRFAKFQVSDWVRPFADEYSFKNTRNANYRIVFPPPDDLLPLSETMLDWTSTAVLLWDDLSPDALTPPQQRAVSDWVRFGGQLIVNGATASDAIARSSMVDLLPLRPTGNIELDPDAAAELLSEWSVARDSTTDKQIAVMRAQSGRVAVDGTAAEDSQPLPGSGKLVLTRRVGSGRVVQPRFDITADWMMNWQSYDSFVNSAILARPRREYVKSNDSSDESYVRQQYYDYGTGFADPAMNTKFRITARDGVLPSSVEGEKRTPVASSRVDRLAHVAPSAGIGGWTDHSDSMQLCREVLRGESGIEIPDSSLVIKSLGYYLLILVPVNYLFFRLIGRLEYAWLAVPLIAIGGAVWVARAARLDIGFARKQTEIGLLELQPEYQRGHLSRVIAIYNSLSSTYEVQFNTIDGVASPVWDDVVSGTPTFRTAFGEGPILSGLAVDSNKTQVLHSEQIVDVGGPISLDGQGNLINQSSFELYDSLVIEKTDAENVRIAMVGACPPGSQVSLRFRDGSTPPITAELPMQTVRLIRRFSSPAAMPNNSTRLVARIESSLPGMTITPIANQIAVQTIVLAHLKHPPIPVPQVDVNLITDFRKAIGRDEEDDSSPEANP